MKFTTILFLMVLSAVNVNAFEVNAVSDCPENVIRFAEAFPDTFKEGLNITTYGNVDGEKTLIVLNIEVSKNEMKIENCAEVSINTEE